MAGGGSRIGWKRSPAKCGVIVSSQAFPRATGNYYQSSVFGPFPRVQVGGGVCGAPGARTLQWSLHRASRAFFQHTRCTRRGARCSATGACIRANPGFRRSEAQCWRSHNCERQGAGPARGFALLEGSAEAWLVFGWGRRRMVPSSGGGGIMAAPEPERHEARASISVVACGMSMSSAVLLQTAGLHAW